MIYLLFISTFSLNQQSEPLDLLSTDIDCSNFSQNCEACFSAGNGICGWCKESKICMNGNSDGPINQTCGDWSFKFDMKCHLESAEPLSLGARIGVAVFSSIIAVGTAVFWICIFPMCSPKPKADDIAHPDYQMQ